MVVRAAMMDIICIVAIAFGMCQGVHIMMVSGVGSVSRDILYPMMGGNVLMFEVIALIVYRIIRERECCIESYLRGNFRIRFRVGSYSTHFWLYYKCLS